MNRLYLILAFFTLAGADGTAVKAQTTNTKELDFLFAEDNQNTRSTEQFLDFVQPKSVVKENAWLNAPMTRLDYVLMMMEARLNKSVGAAALSYIPQSFERASSPLVQPSAEFSVRYYEPKGRLFLSGEIHDVGKPKKPMKAFCRSVLTYMAAVYPQKALGYYWQNTALGVLPRDSSAGRNYVDAVKALAESTLYSITITSTYKVGEREAMFMMSCRQQAPEGEVVYSTYSANLGR